MILFSLEKMRADDTPPKGYPNGVKAVTYPCPADGSEQPALFWAPKTENDKPVPLLVALHTWSSDYRQAGGEVKYAEWCQKNGWVFIHPNFRGPNRTPEALGSDLMIADIRAAVEWTKSQAVVDEMRIYAIGVSGGGHATQLLAGRTPEIWAGISSWCGISDIAAWHAQTIAAGRGNYARNIEGALRGPPDNPERLDDARHRSPLTWLENASEVPLDLNHGINDGRAGSVPFTQTLNAWNAVVPEKAELDEAVIEKFYETRTPPAGRGEVSADPLYGDRPPLFRLVHGNTRVTIFDGGHEIVHEAALNWLAAQRKGQPVNWNPPKIAELKASDAEKQSGK
ncbi:MAG: prolyl oligopeptidase family serine peptidase [Verrucomicrobiae bacterium]|nr:prolyl oligopeptidase family serine peptidase [Verrucomicrobiae bacterium]